MKDLVELLKTERLNRNLTLETVSERSGISLSMLRSIEACDFERLGASLLIRNTIRAYCRALRIDSEPLIQKFSSQIEACNIQDAGLKRYGLQMKILRKKRRMIGLPLFVLFLISAAVFYGGTWISERRSKLYAPPEADRILTQEELPAELHERQVPGPDARAPGSGAALREADEAIRNAEIHIRESEMAAKDAGKADNEGERANDIGWQVNDIDKMAVNTVKRSGEAQEKASGPDDGDRSRLSFSNSTDAVADDEPVQNVEEHSRNKFAVEADDKVWIQVKIDDKKTLSEMLHAGEHREWAADKSLQVVIGNAGGVRMKWNERQLAAPRDPGRVLRFRLPDYAKAE